MKDVHESEVFKLLDKNGAIRKKCQTNLTTNMVNCKDLLEDNLRTVLKVFKDNLTSRAVDAVKNGSLVLYYTKGTDRLPVYYPFIKFKQGGVPKLAIDLSNYITVKKDKLTEEQTANIDVKKLYSLLVSGYLYLTLWYTKDSTVTPELLRITSNLWAKMFCKVLIMKVGLATNQDRLQAFMYLAQKFFLINIVECTPAVAEDIALMQFKDRKPNSTAKVINEACDARGIDLYKDIITFCETLFNADITGLRGMRINGSSDLMTFDYYVRQYIQLYYVTAGLSLASFPHFMWLLISANNFSYIFNDATIEPMCTTEFPKLMSGIYRML